jgi:hypothetical protein
MINFNHDKETYNNCEKEMASMCNREHSNAEVKNDRTVSSLPQYVFVAWCIIN